MTPAPAKLLGAVLAMLLLGATGAPGAGEPAPAAREELARRLFADVRLASPRGDFATSCESCHLLDQDPQGLRAYTDFLARPWFPWRSEDPRREHPRNAPTLLGVGEMPALHLDGEFSTLEELVRSTLTGRPMGWLQDEKPEAERHLREVLTTDPAYRALWRRAFGSDAAALPLPELMTGIADVLAESLRELRSPRRSPYDRFVELNDLPPSPAPGETPARYGERVLEHLESLEQSGQLVLPPGFGGEALSGLRIFLRSRGASAAGNCVVCHTPPAFSDHAFHNVGASQDEYDRAHGAGAFARLALPEAASRPVERLRRAPRPGHPEEADLGHWNYAPAASSGRLATAVGAFKTPSLRNLAYTNPYLHNGRYSTLEETLEAKLRWAEMARRGALRAADPELLPMRFEGEHLRALVALLASLGEELVPGRRVPPLPRPVREGDRRDDYPRF